MNKVLAIFDFDKTITKKDSLIDFLIYINGTKRFIYGIFKCSKNLLLYKLKLISNKQAKESVLTQFFKGLSINDIIAAGDIYAERRLPSILNSKALERINYHMMNKHKLVIVSASAKYWFQKWAYINGFTNIISTELENQNNTLTGKINGNNCYGPEKVTKLKEFINLKEFDYIYAYGDSHGDKELLELANESYLIFKLIK